MLHADGSLYSTYGPTRSLKRKKEKEAFSHFYQKLIWKYANEKIHEKNFHKKLMTYTIGLISDVRNKIS